ncbi:MAG: PEP-CTERM sorting domain-containing protein [Phycisphaerae bacterium]|nr:PEP-CTERM sorting domain-containing protein [Phycisphaerae bacterium]
MPQSRQRRPGASHQRPRAEPADDYCQAILTNGVDTIFLADVHGDALNALDKETFLHYEAAIPDQWTQVWLRILSHTNSSTNAESVDFDHVFFTGVYVPEPAGIALFALTGLILHRRRPRNA